MDYLVFDIECCDGVHICEFGYVLFDECFNVLSRECLTINPEHKFRLGNRRPGREIELAFSEEEYFNSPTFPYYHRKIKEIVEGENRQIVGFSMRNDSKFLYTACDLYGLDSINYKFLDMQKMYKAYKNSKVSDSIQTIVTELGIKDIKLHKSDDDSYAVMRILQYISKIERLSLSDTLDYLKNANGRYYAEQSKEHNIKLLKSINDGNKKAQNEFLKRFIRRLQIVESDNFFCGKIVCIGEHFQKERYNSFLSLVEHLYAVGATYSGRANDCNVFVEYTTENNEDKRLTAVQHAIDNDNKAIEVITLQKAIKILGIADDDLNKKDYTHTKALNMHRSKRNNGACNIDAKTTLGDLLKLQGIDLQITFNDQDEN